MKSLSVVALMVVVVLCASTSRAAVYDAANDFSPTNNPNGVWSYGEEEPPGYGFTTLPGIDYIGVVNNWDDLGDPPDVTHNATTGTVVATTHYAFGTITVVWQPGQIGLAPFGSSYCVVRWTAPTSGVYQISAQFSGLCTNEVPTDVCSNGTQTDVHIMLDGSINSFSPHLFDGSVNGYGPGSETSTTVYQPLQPGDTVDFVAGGDGFCVMTGLKATITRIPDGNADLGVSVAQAPSPTTTFSNVVYTITVTNTGPSDAVEVIVTNTLPQQIIYTGCGIDTNGVCTNPQPGLVTAVFPTFAAGTSESLTITGQVRCSTRNGATFKTTTTVSSLLPDPTNSNNQVSSITTNANPLRKPVCADALAFSESLADKLSCAYGDCETVTADRFTITAAISLEGVDITQINENTPFSVTLGDYSESDSMGDDPSYVAGKTTAFFFDGFTDDQGNEVVDQVIYLKWTAQQLLVTVKARNADIDNSSFSPILAENYDYDSSALITNGLTGSINFGSATIPFDYVYATGKIASHNANPQDQGPFTLAHVTIKGTWSD
ncbi:MAG: DUF11 domain-containing protein [Verrucomicrobiia bacterium]